MNKPSKTPVQHLATAVSPAYAAVGKFASGKRGVFGKRGAALARSMDRFSRDTEAAVAEEILVARADRQPGGLAGLDDLIFDATYRITSNAGVRAAIAAADARAGATGATGPAAPVAPAADAPHPRAAEPLVTPALSRKLAVAAGNARLVGEYLPLLVREVRSDLGTVTFHLRRSLRQVRAKCAALMADNQALSRHLNLAAAASFLGRAGEIRRFGPKSLSLVTGLAAAAVAGGLMLAVDISLPREASASDAATSIVDARKPGKATSPLWAYPITIRESTIGFLDGAETGTFTPPSEDFVAMAKDAVNLVTSDPAATEIHVANALDQLRGCAARELPCRVETMGLVLDARHSRYTITLSKWAGYSNEAVMAVEETRGETRVIDPAALDYLVETNTERFGVSSSPVDNAYRH